MRTARVLITLASALILMAATAISVSAQGAGSDAGDASVSITSDATVNFLSVSITDSEFQAIPYSFTDQSTTGSMTITVTDTRGTGAGWNVNLNATDFVVADQTFDITNLFLTAGTSVGLAFPAPDGPVSSTTGLTAFSAAPVPKTEVSTAKVWSAAPQSGAGQFELPMNGTLNVPGGTLVGTYTSVVTVSVASGP